MPMRSLRRLSRHHPSKLAEYAGALGMQAHPSAVPGHPGRTPKQPDTEHALL